MARPLINVFIACAVLASTTSALYRFRRQEISCSANTACAVNNEDECCTQQSRCCYRNDVKEGRCPRSAPTNRADLMKCMFDYDCAGAEKCCNQLQFCWMPLNAEGECPRYRSALTTCKKCNVAGQKRETDAGTESCCPDGHPQYSGVCRTTFVPPPRPTQAPAGNPATEKPKTDDETTIAAVSNTEAATASGSSSPDGGSSLAGSSPSNSETTPAGASSTVAESAAAGSTSLAREATPAGSTASEGGATPAGSTASEGGATPAGSTASEDGATPAGSSASEAGATPAGSSASEAGATPAGSSAVEGGSTPAGASTPEDVSSPAGSSAPGSESTVGAETTPEVAEGRVAQPMELDKMFCLYFDDGEGTILATIKKGSVAYEVTGSGDGGIFNMPVSR